MFADVVDMNIELVGECGKTMGLDKVSEIPSFREIAIASH
jgi:hypothetical protein